MCRAVLENEEGQSAAKGINDGILYLMSIPYILVFGLGFFVYWKYFKVCTTIRKKEWNRSRRPFKGITLCIDDVVCS